VISHWENREVKMAETSRRVTCAQCGDRLIAPEDAEYIADSGTVRHRWRCSKCGYEFHSDAEPTMPPGLVEKFLPNLLVA
jgi:RNase P subunit RPR2